VLFQNVKGFLKSWAFIWKRTLKSSEVVFSHYCTRSLYLLSSQNFNRLLRILISQRRNLRTRSVSMHWDVQIPKTWNCRYQSVLFSYLIECVIVLASHYRSSSLPMHRLLSLVESMCVGLESLCRIIRQVLPLLQIVLWKLGLKISMKKLVKLIEHCRHVSQIKNWFFCFWFFLKNARLIKYHDRLLLS